MHDEIRAARAALTQTVEPLDGEAVALIREVGPVDALRVIRRELPAPIGYERAVVRWGGWRPLPEPEALLARAAEYGGGFIIPEDLGWPEGFAELGTAAPIGLWYSGDIEALREPAMTGAVIGSRDATAYGLTVGADVANALRKNGYTVCSGLAYGIEGHALATALHTGSTGLPAVGVAATGIDRTYPSGNADLVAQLRETGLILSELAPGLAPTRSRLIARNRLIAALAGVVCLVEASPRSASLETARIADRLSRRVLGVPGPLYSLTSSGVHALLSDGTAECLTGTHDVVTTLHDGTE
ncbi:DNA processing protein DprA [Sinomonas humi]|uniref:Smf/DprA SLOG domain-containing protein n=1 Tax=Sinomonas humi TaxID=1338436 RepID=A0A0B2AKA1_9MICC|nr:DNA processing protein DprA [Sinomonas humi]KHL03801.1 hypothetical protein LK10_08430 [Sinomonas humi]